MLVSQRAAAGTALLFWVAKSLGISWVFAAENKTSAQMRDQARYAPSTETINPTLTKIAPQCPTTASSTPAIEGWRISAICARDSTAYGNNVTRTSRQVTPRKPSNVAVPTSARVRAYREYTLAPSMPINTNTVINIVAR